MSLNATVARVTQRIVERSNSASSPRGATIFGSRAEKR